MTHTYTTLCLEQRRRKRLASVIWESDSGVPIFLWLLLHVEIFLRIYVLFFLLQERIKQTNSSEDITDPRDIALEEPNHPEIQEERRPVPDTHFIVEEQVHEEPRFPCALCLIQ